MEERGAEGSVPKGVQLKALIRRRSRQQWADGTALGASLVGPALFVGFSVFLVTSIGDNIPTEGPLSGGTAPAIYAFITAEAEDPLWVPVVTVEDSGIDPVSQGQFDGFNSFVLSKGGVEPATIVAEWDTVPELLEDLLNEDFPDAVPEDGQAIGGYSLNGPLNETGVVTDGAIFSTGLNATLTYSQSAFSGSLLTMVHSMQAAMWFNLTGGSNFTRDFFDLNVGLHTALFPGVDLFSVIVPPFLVMGMFNAIPQMAAGLVKEREEGTKFQLQVSGVSAPVYWLSNFVIDFALYFLVVLVIAVALAIGAQPVWTDVSKLAWALLFVLMAPVVVLCGYCLQYLFDSDETANKVLNPLVSFLVFVPYFVVQFLFEGNLSRPVRLGFSLLIPTYNPFNAITSLGLGAGQGRPLDTVAKVFSTDDDFVINMGICVVHIVALVVILLLLDRRTRVGTSGSANKVAPAAPLDAPVSVRVDNGSPGGSPKTPKPPLRGLQAAEAVLLGQMTDDGVEEEKRLAKDASNPDLLIRIDGVKKTFDGEKWPVKGVSLSIRKGECFGLLGKNGAGKTTLVSMLSGQIAVSAGDATIVGHSVTNEMDLIYKHLGVCPQFDRLWPDITVRQHLKVYAAVKGIPEDRAEEEVNRVIDILGLTPHADKASKNLSGGNKRKTSVAMAVLGRPPIVFLDEPTTGMDPATRRALWDVILDLAKESSIILTTHSMEEADALCSRIGIMVNGEMVTVGSTQALKSRYGGGYRVSTRSSTPEEAAKVGAMVQDMYKDDCRTMSALGSTQSFEVRSEAMDLSNTFRVLEQARGEQLVLDYSVSQTTLEQVFLAFAEQQDEDKNAKAPKSKKK